MYPGVNKQHLPSVPPSDLNLNAPQYDGDPANSPPRYAPTIAYPQPTQVINSVQGTSIPPLGPRPVHLTCPSCNSLVVTRIEEVTLPTAYMCCLILCVIGCVCCSCVPLCMDSFKNCNHSCPRCNAFIGIYKPS